MWSMSATEILEWHWAKYRVSGIGGAFPTRHGLSLHVSRLVGLWMGSSKAVVILVFGFQLCYVITVLHFQSICEGKHHVRSLGVVVLDVIFSCKSQTTPTNCSSKDYIHRTGSGTVYIQKSEWNYLIEFQWNDDHLLVTRYYIVLNKGAFIHRAPSGV